MAGPRKRKHAATIDTQPGIEAFAKVCKTAVKDDGSKKRKMDHGAQQGMFVMPHIVVSQPDRKRKRNTKLEEDDSELDMEHKSQKAMSHRSSNTGEIRTPRTKRVKKLQPSSPFDTPTKSAAAMMNKLRLDSNSAAIPFTLAAKLPDTPPDTPEAEKPAQDRMPQELKDLTHLHAAFLSATSLYYAHNGTTSPVNVKALLPMVTAHWKRRTVTLDDLRITFAIGRDDEAAFALEDFGRAGICIVKSRPRGRTLMRAASYVDETELNARFEVALRMRWVEWQAATLKENLNPVAFLDQLPLAEIKKNESAEKAAPLFARGQQRLAELQAGQNAARTALRTSSEAEPEAKKPVAIQTRGSNLLDRILAKQALTASLPAGPTKANLERKAALQRVEEIARVLDLLAGNRPRCSFGLQAMTQQLQQSLRSPISKEDVERCLGLMAKEITPGFVIIVQNGSMTGVVVVKAAKVAVEEIRRRVQDAGA